MIFKNITDIENPSPMEGKFLFHNSEKEFVNEQTRNSKRNW